MRIVIPGGSGFLGQAIARFFTERGDSVVVLTRSPQQGRESEEVAWDGRSLGEWADVIDGSDVVINLAGRNVNCRYTPENRREIMESRVASTRVLGQAIAAARNPPSLWLQSSTATIYAHRFDAPNDEATGIIGGNEPDAPDNWRFSIEVARAWERELDKADTPATRKVAMRTAVVMGTDPSGPFAILKRLARFGLGGPVGSGNQYVSWLHIDDLCRSLLWLIEHPELFPYSEDKSKGAFMGCPSGWGCQPANANMFRAFDMEEKGWVLVDPGSAAGLEGSIAKAAEREQPWFGYYWNPTAVIGKYKLVPLAFETEWAGSENWDGCIVKSESECMDPKPSSWTKSEVSTVVTADVPDIAPESVLTYLKSRVFPGEVMNEMLVYMTDNQAIGEDAAYEFLAKHEEVWTQWVTPEIAEKVKDAL